MKISICGVPYEVVEKDDSFSADTVHFGEIEYAKCQIRINKNLTEAGKKETLCHEIAHAIMAHIGRSDLGQDETFVQSLGNAIYQTFEIKTIKNSKN